MKRLPDAALQRLPNGSRLANNAASNDEAADRQDRTMSAVPCDRYWLVARDEAGLLTHMMRFLAGQARISFVGDLSRCEFPATLRCSTDEDSMLTRQTISPKPDFKILPLEHDSVRPILDAIMPDNRYMEDIIHIQIEKRGELQFGCYDQFHRDCIVCFLAVPAKFLDELRLKGVLRSWTTPHEGATRWHG